MSYGDNNGMGGGSYVPSVNGTLILVFGILSVIGFAIFGPIAWIMGNNAAKVSGGDPQQANLANIGRILGIIGTVFLILGAIWFVFAGAAMIAAVSSAASSAPRP
ncbi:MAG: DUF4190 domain-containing protein [Armatimonadota bacterium]